MVDDTGDCLASLSHVLSSESLADSDTFFHCSFPVFYLHFTALRAQYDLPEVAAA